VERCGHARARASARPRHALLVDSAYYVAYFEDPAYSELVGEIGYAPPPLGPTGSRRPNLWTWSVVMNSRVRDGDAAWRFIEWATGRDFLRRSVFEGNMIPTRSSIWDDGGFRAHPSGWERSTMSHGHWSSATRRCSSPRRRTTSRSQTGGYARSWTPTPGASTSRRHSTPRPWASTSSSRPERAAPWYP